MIGRTIAHYEILDKLGEGGWAWSTRPVTLTWTASWPSKSCRPRKSLTEDPQPARQVAVEVRPDCRPVAEAPGAGSTSFSRWAARKD
jgi:hypothetical protein